MGSKDKFVLFVAKFFGKLYKEMKIIVMTTGSKKKCSLHLWVVQVPPSFNFQAIQWLSEAHSQESCWGHEASVGLAAETGRLQGFASSGGYNANFCGYAGSLDGPHN